MMNYCKTNAIQHNSLNILLLVICNGLVSFTTWTVKSHKL